MRVTLYVWLPSRMLNIHTPQSALNILAKLSLGHAALRTYQGGPNGNGIYASYWPGNCGGWHQNLINDESIHISVRQLLCLEDT